MWLSEPVDGGGASRYERMHAWYQTMSIGASSSIAQLGSALERHIAHRHGHILPVSPILETFQVRHPTFLKLYRFPCQPQAQPVRPGPPTGKL